MNALLKNSLVALLITAIPVLGGEPPKSATPTPVLPVHSTFILPTNYREGRDPFFPESQRLYEEIAPHPPVDAATFLHLKGISLENGHRAAIINNHTFEAGEEGDVITSEHTKVHLRLISIQPDSVVVESNGTRRQLKLTEK